MAHIISDYYAEFACGWGCALSFPSSTPVPILSSMTSMMSRPIFPSCLPCEETVDQKERTMPLRAKEKMRNAKNLALLSSWVFLLLDRAADRPFSNTEANYLPGVKENVSFGCSGFSQCNKSPPWDPSFIWFNKDFKVKRSFFAFIKNYWSLVSVSFGLLTGCDLSTWRHFWPFRLQLSAFICLWHPPSCLLGS